MAAMEQSFTEPADPGEKTLEPPPLPPRIGKSKVKPEPSTPTIPPANPQKCSKQLTTPSLGHAKEKPPKPQTNISRKPLPPLPPGHSQLLPTNAEFRDTHAHTQLPEKREMHQVLSEELTLHELTQNYSQSFPLRIAVVSGYHDPYNRSTISNGDVYNIHFLKHQKVVTIRDSKSCFYSIPLNSSVQFAIVYDPDNQLQQGREIKSHMFQTAGNIMDAEVLPKVVCATKAFKGPNSISSVKENEILIVCHVQKLKRHGKKTLEVFSLDTCTKKMLSYECDGHFSTESSLIKLTLPQIVVHLPRAFPCKAIIFLEDDFTSSLSSDLCSNFVTAVEMKTETSLIVSSMWYGMGEESQLLDIPIDDAMSIVKVCVIESDDETEKLYNNTQRMFANLDLSKLVSYKATDSEEIYTTQSLFYATFQKGSERVGIELHAPAAVYQDIDTPVGQTEVANGTKTVTEMKPFPSTRHPLPPIPLEDTMLQPVHSSPLLGDLPLRPCLVKSESLPPFSQGNTGAAVIMAPTSIAAGNIRKTFSEDSLSPSSQVGARKVQTFSSTASGGNSSHIYRTLDPKLRQHERQYDSLTVLPPVHLEKLKQYKPHSQHPGSKREQSVEDNKMFLLSLNVTQVQNLLEAMGLTRYGNAFAKERISGEILAELDEDILQHELGVNSKIHRIRLMKVITGKHSAQNILTGLDPLRM